VNVTDGIAAAADGEALSPIRNLGERLVVLKHLFGDFKGNINWEEDDDEDEDDANGMVAHTNSPKDKAWWMKKKHTEGSYHDLLSLPCLIVNRGGCVICVCLCVSLCQVCVAPARNQQICRKYISLRNFYNLSRIYCIFNQT
jgi:hypothetical protein